MTTPTKEQIVKISNKLIKERVKLLKSCGFTRYEISDRIYVEDVRDFVANGIKEWEKIRNSPKYGKI